MNDYKTLLNSNIKKLRKEFNLSRDEFAEKVGVSTDTICNLENNRYAPKPETIDKICSAYNVQYFELLAPEKFSDKKDIISFINLKLNTLNENDLNKLSDIIDIFKKYY